MPKIIIIKSLIKFQSCGCVQLGAVPQHMVSLTRLKAISQTATESADIPAGMLDEIGTIPDQDSVVEVARSFKVTERYVCKRIADRNRANFLDSGDVDLSDEEIAAKYGIRKASVTSWKAEADRMWYSWFAQVDFGQLAAQVQQCILTAYAVSVLSFYLNVMCNGLINSVCLTHIGPRPFRALRLICVS